MRSEPLPSPRSARALGSGTNAMSSRANIGSVFPQQSTTIGETSEILPTDFEPTALALKGPVNTLPVRVVQAPAAIENAEFVAPPRPDP